MMHISREFNRLSDVNGEDMSALNLAVVSGGQWPRQRQKDAGYDISSLCLRCLENQKRYSIGCGNVPITSSIRNSRIQNTCSQMPRFNMKLLLGSGFEEFLE